MVVNLLDNVLADIAGNTGIRLEHSQTQLTNVHRLGLDRALKVTNDVRNFAKRMSDLPDVGIESRREIEVAVQKRGSRGLYASSRRCGATALAVR